MTTTQEAGEGMERCPFQVGDVVRVKRIPSKPWTGDWPEHEEHVLVGIQLEGKKFNLTIASDFVGPTDGFELDDLVLVSRPLQASEHGGMTMAKTQEEMIEAVAKALRMSVLDYHSDAKVHPNIAQSLIMARAATATLEPLIRAQVVEECAREIERLASVADCGCRPCYGHAEREATYEECAETIRSLTNKDTV